MKQKFYGILCVYMLMATLAFAQKGSLLNTPYKPSFKKGSIDAYLADIQSKTHISVSFSSASIDFSQQVSIKGKDQTIGGVLKEILSGQSIEIIERKDKILLVPQAIKKKGVQKLTTTINGYIKDKDNKEVLIGAILYVPDVGTAATTNEYGYYSITIPSGAHSIITSYIGYTTDTFYFNIDEDLRKDIYLDAGKALTEVVVKSKDKRVGYTQLSINDINGKPTLLGESDVMRALQNQAGVQCGADGTSSVLVRGGDPGQNLNLLDGVPVYYVDHFFGLTSVFNNEAIKSVDFYKGAFPARYGGRLSSVIDVNTKDGDMEKWGGQFTMGLVKGSLSLEGPIVKDKASVMLSARRTWLDLFWRPFTNDLKLDFYDINAKVNYILNENNRLYVSFYNGRDQLSGNGDILNSRGRWGNTVTSAKWNRIVSPKFFVNTIFTYSTFKYQLNENTSAADSISGNNTAAYTNSSLITDASIKVRGNWYPSSKHKVETGIQYTSSNFIPVSVESTSPNNLVTTQSTSFRSNEITLYAEDEIKLTDKWTLRPGLHWANWLSNNYTYSSLQPRIFTSYKINNDHIIYGSATKMSQFLHAISNNMSGFQSDFWLPSTDKILPEESVMGSLGYSGHAFKNFDFNIEGYYKDIQNVTMYNPGTNIFDNAATWDDKLLQGKGWSYGTEISLQEKAGPFYFNAAYTLSWSWRRFDGLNSGKAFPYKYDRRHNLKTSISYKPSRKFAATANWTYMSGETITIPNQVYGDLDDNLLVNTTGYTTGNSYIFTYTDWNNYRLPPIHRLDISFDFIKQKRKSERTWSIGVFNAYGRKNILYVDVVTTGSGQFALKGQSFFMYIPYISYRLKF